jgi:polysaccharide biosynthesis transport protein
MKELTQASFGLPPLSHRGDAELSMRPPTVEDEAISLWDCCRVIRKHLILIAILCFGTVLAATLTILLMTPIYTAETTLLIERTTPQVLSIKEVVSEPLGPDEYDFYKTQYEILKSRMLAARVIREQDLETNRVFTGEGREIWLVTKLWGDAKRWATQQQWARPFFTRVLDTGEEQSLGIEPGLIDDSMVDRYMQMLEIQPVQRTRLVKIVFKTPDPQLSAHLANAHAQTYIRHGIGQRVQANEEAQRFLADKLVELKERMEHSSAALNRYRQQRAIISPDEKENIVVERLADLNKRLTEAETDRIALEAQMRLLRNRDHDALPATTSNPVIGTLKQQLAQLQGEYISQSTLYKPGHRRLDQLQAEMEETKRQLRQEIQRVVSSLESSYLAAQAKEKALRGKMEEQKAAALNLKNAAVEYALLAREVDSNRELYESVLQRMKETRVVADLSVSNVSVIDQANPPRKPSKPQKAQILLLSAFTGLIGGVGLAFFLAHRDNALKTPEEVERYLRLPSLAVVPDFLSVGWRRHAPRRLPYTPPPMPSLPIARKKISRTRSHHLFSMVAETYRMLRTSILLSRPGEPPKTILFASGIHGEGKTVTTVNTAIIFAQMGVKVLVIDADLRRPDCHRVLGMDNGAGLTEVLTGQIGPREACLPTALENLSFLSAGSLPPNPAELVGSRTMQETIAALKEHYDYILIDSPPVMQVSDAVLLSTMVEGVVLVVSSQQTSRDVVRETHARLSYARSQVLGVVLNRASPRSGDSVYYYDFYSS